MDDLLGANIRFVVISGFCGRFGVVVVESKSCACCDVGRALSAFKLWPKDPGSLCKPQHQPHQPLERHPSPYQSLSNFMHDLCKVCPDISSRERNRSGPFGILELASRQRVRQMHAFGAPRSHQEAGQ